MIISMVPISDPLRIYSFGITMHIGKIHGDHFVEIEKGVPVPDAYYEIGHGLVKGGVRKAGSNVPRRT